MGAYGAFTRTPQLAAPATLARGRVGLRSGLGGHFRRMADIGQIHERCCGLGGLANLAGVKWNTLGRAALNSRPTIDAELIAGGDSS